MLIFSVHVSTGWNFLAINNKKSIDIFFMLPTLRVLTAATLAAIFTLGQDNGSSLLPYGFR